MSETVAAIFCVAFIGLIVFLSWFFYRKADGNITTLLRWSRNVTVIEMLASLIIWLIKSSNVGTYFDKDGTTLILYLDAFILLLCFILPPFYKKYQTRYESNEFSMGKKKRPLSYDYNKYTGRRSFTSFSFLSLSMVLLLNIWNVYAFFTTYIIHR